MALGLVAAGCAGSNQADPGRPVGTGGKGAAISTGGSGTGGSVVVPPGTGGMAVSFPQTGGASEPPASTGGSSASGGGGSVGPTSTGGGTAGHGDPVGSTGGRGGAAPVSSGGAGGLPPGMAGAPPPRDTASKVPASPAPGYTVEANYAYGPETAQRIDVIYPTGAGPKGTQVLPVVLMFHGGAWIHSYNNGSGKDHMTTFSSRYLAHGFMVCNAEYRVSDGSADAAPAPAAVVDALLAAKWCWDYMDYFHGDKTRFVVTGASAGGHLALMVGMTTAAGMLGPTSPADFKIAGIVSGYGPADIESEINAVAGAWLPSSLPNRAAIAKQVNPMTYVRKDIPPLIVVQGANDHTAPVADSMRLVSMLTAAGADASIHLVPGAGHGFTAGAEWDDAEKAMFDWLTSKGLNGK